MKNLAKINIWYKWCFSITTSVIGSFAYDLLKGKPILSTLVDIIKAMWNFMLSILKYDLKVWWVLLTIGFISVVIYLSRYLNTQDNREPEFTKYREDVFKSWKWTWEWKLDTQANKWKIINLKARCPKCGATLIDSSYLTINYHCPRCDYRAMDIYAENKNHIKSLINDNIERG